MLLIIFVISHITPKEILVVFHNVSKYDYHFIIKELVEELERQIECLGEITGKHRIILVPMEKLDNGKRSKYKLKFIDSFRFMSSSLTSLVDNLTEGLHNNKCKDCKPCFEYIPTKDSQLLFKCLK